MINKDFFVKLEINLKLKDHDLAEELEKKIEVIFVLHMWSKEGNNPVDVSGLQLDGIEVSLGGKFLFPPTPQSIFRSLMFRRFVTFCQGSQMEGS